MNAPVIHPTALVDTSAEIGEGCLIGPHCVIGAGVRLGAGCILDHHVTLGGPSTIGARNRFYPYACIGLQSQDLKYSGEPTYLEIGSNNTFREFCTVHRATAPEGCTRIGSRGNFLAYSHIAHDCTVGDDVIFSNNGTLAGHVEVGDFAVIGGLTAIHQFCRIGPHAITGGCSKIVQDVPPFLIADGNPAAIRGVNTTGLERRGFSADRIRAIKDAYKILYIKKLPKAEALSELQSISHQVPEAATLAAFIASSKRGIIR